MYFSWDGPGQRMREISLDQTKTQQYDKLVFVGLSPNFLSLRDQCAHWSWQSPGCMEPGNDFHQKSRRLPFFQVLFGT